MLRKMRLNETSKSINKSQFHDINITLNFFLLTFHICMKWLISIIKSVAECDICENNWNAQLSLHQISRMENKSHNYWHYSKWKTIRYSEIELNVKVNKRTASWRHTKRHHSVERIERYIYEGRKNMNCMCPGEPSEETILNKKQTT